MTALKSLLFLILVPGVLLGYLPYSIALTDIELLDLGFIRYLAFPLWVVGGTAMLWCFWNFSFDGRGTPAPIDPPKELVAVGLYRFVRNPMYGSGIISLIGWILWSPSQPLIVTPFLFFIAAHLFVTLYEEPTLKKKFGAAYTDYCAKAPRWMPRLDVAALKQHARALKRETLALYCAYRDPRTPLIAKLWALLVLIYAFSPIDLIPDFIPVLGYLDDILLVPAGIALAIKLIPAEVMAAARLTAAQEAGEMNQLGSLGAALIIFVWILILVWLARLILNRLYN